jgi:hypothetical protein
LNGIKERRGKPRSDMPWIETEEDAEFLKFIKCFHEQQRPKILGLLDTYGDKDIFVFTDREQADAFIDSISMMKTKGNDGYDRTGKD